MVFFLTEHASVNITAENSRMIRDLLNDRGDFKINLITGQFK
jgi:hypothetical protein